MAPRGRQEETKGSKGGAKQSVLVTGPLTPAVARVPSVQSLDSRALENWLWEASCRIRGAVDAPKFKDYILPLIFVKRLSDVFDDEFARLKDQIGDEATARELVTQDRGLVRFFIPDLAKWDRIRSLSMRVGERVTDALRAVAKENPRLQGVIDVVDFNATHAGERVIDDVRLQNLIEALSDPRYRLGLKDVEPDILGRAYEYLLRKFAEGQGQSAGEFFTPKEVGWLIARLVNPQEGETVYDPACGSGGLLIKCELLLKEREGVVSKPLRLYGQESNHVTYAMSRMNMIVHDMEGEIAIGDTLRNPKFLDGGALRKFDAVVANPMWMQKDYDGSFYESDPFNRFWAGYPTTSTADWGWIQHMLASLGERGRAAVVIDSGSVSRGSGGEGTSREKEIRAQFVRHDFIEAVILLPDNLFYNTSGDGTILVLNRSKSDSRKGRLLLVNAAAEYSKGTPKNYLSDSSIMKVSGTFHAWTELPDFSRILTSDEVERNDFNLHPAKYVGGGPTEEVTPIEEAVERLGRARRAEGAAEVELESELKALRLRRMA